MPIDQTKRATMWSGTQFVIEAFEGQQNEAARLGWTCLGQKENCPKTGKPHYQFAVKTPQVRMSQVRKVFQGAHIEEARNKAALEQYVHKEETRCGDMPKVSNMYPTLDQYWGLVYDTLSSGDCDKEFRITPSSRTTWYRGNMSKDNTLAALDHATAELIENGYRVETHAVNPQVRSAFAKFSTNIFRRTYVDRQTDRQPRLISHDTSNAREDSSEPSSGSGSSETSLIEEEDDDEGSEGGDVYSGSEGGSEEDSLVSR